MANNFEEFIEILHQDQPYPFEPESPSSARMLFFDILAYIVEDKFGLLKNKNDLCGIIYPLIDRSIVNGEISYVLENILKLSPKSLKKFNEVLKRTELEDIIVYSEKVSRKLEDLAFLEKLTITEPSKHVKERKELQKFLSKMLWVFGEQYDSYSKLLSDRNLENQLKVLRDDCMIFKASKEDDNQDATLKVRNVTDLFMSLTKILDEDSQEIMVVELKAPHVKISPKELQQIRKFAFKIEESNSPSPGTHFKIFLLGNAVNKMAKMELNDPRDPSLLWRKDEGNIEIHVQQWSDIIDENKRKLRFMLEQLKIKEVEAIESVKRDFLSIDFGLI